MHTARSVLVLTNTLCAPTFPDQALPGLNASGQKKRLQIHPAGLLIILLGFGAWVVALGGVGSATSNCASGLASNVAPGQSVAVNCAKVYQWQWWGLWFEGCMLVAMFVAVFFEAFNKGKQIVISYLIMCTMILMQGSNYFITNSQLGTGNFSIKSKLQVRAKGQEFGGKCNRTLRLPSLHHSCAASYCPHCACVLTPAWCRCFCCCRWRTTRAQQGTLFWQSSTSVCSLSSATSPDR
jgi:hypothetical protein